MERPASVQRNAGLDALRAAMTVLVVLHHTALTYGAIGGWYFHEVPADGGVSTKLLILFCTINQAFFMGLFFLIAGYFTPDALARKGGGRFLGDRVRRLGVPLLFYTCVLSPLTIMLAQTARGHAPLATLHYLWIHREVDTGPLWFAQALLIFSLGYVLWRNVAGAGDRFRRFPSNTLMTAAMLVTGLIAFILRLAWPVGVNVFGLQIGYFAGYVVLFAAGCAGASGRWLTEVPDRQRRTWGVIALVCLPIFPAIELVAPSFAGLGDRSEGGWNLQALTYAFWEPLIAWGIILWLLRRFAGGDRRLGPVWTSLSRRAFAIYIIHPPVLVAIAMAWRRVEAPHLLKFAVTGGLACLACFWIAGLMLRVPTIRRVV